MPSGDILPSTEHHSIGEGTPNGRKAVPKVLLLLHGVLLVLSLSGVASKFASRQEFLSLPFCMFYGVVLLILAFYALAWQQVIKRLPLTFAYANRAITVVWGIVWGVLFFGERVTPLMLIGAIIIIMGIVLYALDGTGEDETHE